MAFFFLNRSGSDSVGELLIRKKNYLLMKFISEIALQVLADLADLADKFPFEK